jgi:hypothetical protein
LNKAYRPYNYDYKYRKIDPSLPSYKKVSLRGQYAVEDTRAFAIDMLKGDSNAVMFKVAGYSKR